MENKQTALEWFTNEITLFGSIKIDSNGKEFIQFNYSLYHKVLLEAKQMEKEQTTDKMNTNNNTQTKTTWTENKRWLAAIIGLLCVVGFVSVLFVYNLFLHVLAGVLGVWLLSMLLVVFKDLVDDLIDGW